MKQRHNITYSRGPSVQAVRPGGIQGAFEPTLWRWDGHEAHFEAQAPRGYRTLYGARMAALRMWGRAS